MTPRKKREMCPICKVVSLKPAYYKQMKSGTLQWFGKDILICPTKFCPVVVTHTNNRVLYLVPHPGLKLKIKHGNLISTHVLGKSLDK